MEFASETSLGNEVGIKESPLEKISESDAGRLDVNTLDKPIALESGETNHMEVLDSEEAVDEHPLERLPEGEQPLPLETLDEPVAVEAQIDDNGNAYRIGDELIPDNAYEINGYAYFTDEAGRIEHVEGPLQLKDHNERLPIKDSIEVIGKGDQRITDDRGHLIADQFNGSNGLENLIPQDANINRKDYRFFENALAREVKAGKEVYMKIDVIYSNDSHRPSELWVQYSIDGKGKMRSFPNE